MGTIVDRSVKTSNKFFLFRSKKLLFIYILIAIVVIGGSIAIIIFRRQSMVQTNDNNDNLAATAYSNSEMLNEAMRLIDTGDVDSALELYDQAISSAKTDKDKSSFLIVKATYYYNSQDYDNALEIAKQAETLDKSVNVFDFIASIYEIKHEDSMALTYYSKAVTLLESNADINQTDLEYYKYKVSELSE